MNTVFLLMAEYNATDIPLESVASKYLGIERREAYNRAARQSLPFPAYRPGGTQKSPWVVRITDLAEYLDAARAAAQRDWQEIHQAASCEKPWFAYCPDAGIEFFETKTEAEVKCNYRLMPVGDAAPDLLQVLKDIEAMLNAGLDASIVMDENSPMRDAMRDAIAKAEGGECGRR